MISIRPVALGVIALALATPGGARADADLPATWPGLIAHLEGGGRVALDPDGPWRTVARGGHHLEVYDDTGPNPRFVTQVYSKHGVLALAFYVERAGLRRVTLPGAVVLPAPHAPAGPRAAHWRPPIGTPIGSHAPPRDGFVEVRIDRRFDGEHGFVVYGHVAERHVGTVYKTAFLDAAAFSPDVTVGVAVDVLAAPGGGRFASIRGRAPIPAKRLLARKGFALVRFAEGIVGWVPAKPIKRLRAEAYEDGEEGGVEGGVVGGVAEGGAVPAGALRPGTPLHAKPGGAIVGSVVATYHDAPAERAGTWRRFEVATQFGVVSVWAEP